MDTSYDRPVDTSHLESGVLEPVSGAVRPLKAPNKIIAFDDPLIPWTERIVSSPKLDGNRGLCINGELFTSSMKSPRNDNLPEWMQPLIDLAVKLRFFFDYELYNPEASHHAELSGTLNSICDPLPKSMGCYIFDGGPLVEFYKQCMDFPYSERYHLYYRHVRTLSDPRFIPLIQRPCQDAAQALLFYQRDLANGCEGSMLRTLDIGDRGGKPFGGYYKFGRGTFNQSIIWKFKPFETCDGTIVAVEQRRKMKDNVPRTLNEMGLLARSNRLADYEHIDMVGAFWIRYRTDKGEIRDCKVGFGKGFDFAERRRLWQRHQANDLRGKHVEFKHMPHGALETGRARHGLLVRFRPDLDE